MCDLPAAHSLKTIGRLDHCSSPLNFGITRGFSNEFADRGTPRFFRPLLYQLSYLGGAPFYAVRPMLTSHQWILAGAATPHRMSFAVAP
jgi:hypothetical protein